MTLDEALFGIDKFVSRIPFKTSAGPVLRMLGIKNKYDLFDPSDDELYKYRLNAEIPKYINEGIEMLKNGIAIIPTSQFVAKNEVRTAEKLLNFKIRLFTNLDARFNILARMYLMPLIMLLLSDPEASECYGGMNAGSKQWDKLGKRIFFDVEDGKEIDLENIDMDFESYDTCHGPKSFRVVAYFFYCFGKKVGYSEEAAYITFMIIISAGVQLMKYIKSWFLKYGGLASGFILTLIFNSVMNSILIRMAWCSVGLKLKEFKKNVKVATVGDDNASGVNPKHIKVFNMLTIQPLYEHWGYKVTSASKGELKATISREETQFVKRKFIYSEELNGFIAPLEKDSIFKSLCFEDKNISNSPVERLIQVSSGAQREMFLHGRKSFDDFQGNIKTWFEKVGVEPVILNYDALKIEYLGDEFTTFDC
jgi:hypothetical protein